MDNKKLFVIVIIAVSLILLYILIASLIQKEEEVNSPSQDRVKIVYTCEDRCEQDLGCLHACYYVEINQAVVNKDVKLCDKISPLIKQRCIDRVNQQS